MQPDNLDVFDFDGTLIQVNSFREITKRFSIVLLKKVQISHLLALSFWYVLRRAGIISHIAFKQRVVKIFEESLSEEEKRRICQVVFDDNANKALLERMADSKNCIVCTAAPFAYVSRVSFNKAIPIISALDPGERFPDTANFGPGKIENLKAYFKEEGVRVINFFTDSVTDDRALIDLAVNAFIVNGEDITKVK